MCCNLGYRQARNTLFEDFLFFKVLCSCMLQKLYNVHVEEIFGGLENTHFKRCCQEKYSNQLENPSYQPWERLLWYWNVVNEWCGGVGSVTSSCVNAPAVAASADKYNNYQKYMLMKTVLSFSVGMAEHVNGLYCFHCYFGANALKSMLKE